MMNQRRYFLISDKKNNIEFIIFYYYLKQRIFSETRRKTKEKERNQDFILVFCRAIFFSYYLRDR